MNPGPKDLQFGFYAVVFVTMAINGQLVVSKRLVVLVEKWIPISQDS